ncbi:MAG: DNA-binding protein [Runella slithyformis]|jgi:hypothetical protein|nr:MAG: DNA-binding protein [Runella slithyformis]
MQNPFEVIASRLTNIEELILSLKHGELYPTPAPASGRKRYLTAKEAAAFMGIAIQTLYQSIDGIPHIKKHGKLLFVEAELIAYLEGGRAK